MGLSFREIPSWLPFPDRSFLGFPTLARAVWPVLPTEHFEEVPLWGGPFVPSGSCSMIVTRFPFLSVLVWRRRWALQAMSGNDFPFWGLFQKEFGFPQPPPTLRQQRRVDIRWMGYEKNEADQNYSMRKFQSPWHCWIDNNWNWHFFLSTQAFAFGASRQPAWVCSGLPGSPNPAGMPLLASSPSDWGEFKRSSPTGPPCKEGEQFEELASPC